MNLKSIAGKLVKWVVIPYVALYTALAVYGVIDYKVHYNSRVEQNQTQSLQVHRYKTVIGGKEKQFTLIGEIHQYTIKENEFARKLVDEHNSFASESGDSGCDNLPLKDKAIRYATRLAITVPSKFSTAGNGRVFDSARKIVQKDGKKVHSLEGCLTENISYAEHGKLLAQYAYLNLVAPLIYYTAKEGPDPDGTDCTDSPIAKSLSKRDRLQAEGLARLLKSGEVDNLLATVGKCHLDGVIRSLSEEIELEEVR